MKQGFCVIPELRALERMLMKQAGSILLLVTFVVTWGTVSLVRGCICQRLFQSRVEWERRCLYTNWLRIFCYKWYQKPIQFASTFLPIIFICYTMLLTAFYQMIICHDILIQDGQGNM